MSDMVRKQFYISKRQHILLKRLAQVRGVSEAEIVRRTDAEREGVDGFAAKFVAFEGDGGERLRGFLDGGAV